MADRESGGDGGCLRVRERRGQPAPPLGIGQLLPLGGELALARGQRVAQRRDGGPGFHQGVPQRSGDGAWIGGLAAPLAEEPVQTGFEAFEHDTSGCGLRRTPPTGCRKAPMRLGELMLGPENGGVKRTLFPEPEDPRSLPVGLD